MSAPKPTPDAWVKCKECGGSGEINYGEGVCGQGDARLVAAVQLGASYLEGQAGLIQLSKVDVSGFVSRWRWTLGTTPVRVLREPS